MDTELRGVHVLVTGASGGIDQGAKVTAQYNTSPSAFDALLQTDGDGLFPVQADLTSERQVWDLFARATAKWGRPVESLVVNHGIWPTADAPVAEMSLAQWNTTISTNLTSSFLAARAYLQGLKAAPRDAAQKANASIVFVGSTAGAFGEAGHADYATSKSGMMYGLTLSLKNEIVKIAPRGRVNCVAPGWTVTPMAEEALKVRSIVYNAVATTPMRKFATPRDIANQIVIIASPALSGHVSGQVIVVAGGMEGRLLNRPEDVELPP